MNNPTLLKCDDEFSLTSIYNIISNQEICGSNLPTLIVLKENL